MIPVRNIYHMLAYAFSALNEDGYKKVASEDFEHGLDLFAAILAKGIADQIKRGLSRGYTHKSEALSVPTGKINVTDSIKSNTLIKKRLICDFDEYNENILVNQILRTTAKLLIASNEVNLKHRKHLKKNILYFDNVDELNIQRIDWAKIKYHRNNATYKMLLNICYLIIEGMLISQQSGTQKLSEYIDDQKMHKLYEKFVFQYLKRHYPQFKVTASYIDWSVEDGIIDYLPAMKSDIMLENNKKILIIDTKYYSSSMHTNTMFNNRTIHSSNLYQIFTYVKNKALATDKVVQGLLLYAKTDEDITPNQVYAMSGNQISVKTLDLNNEFFKIEKQLKTIVMEHFNEG